MQYLQVLILAIIQGMAELLPVSSSAHVIVAEKLMGLDPSSPRMTFLLVMLHTGTMLAVLFYFWPRWRPMLASGQRTRYLKMIALATVCTGMVAYGLELLIENVILMRVLGHNKGELEDLFKHLSLVSAGLLASGLLILWAGRHDDGKGAPEPTLRSVIWVGLVQGLCIPFRGFSRSGATISTALIQRVARPAAEDFSFVLALVLTPAAIVRLLRRLLRSGDLSSGGLTDTYSTAMLGMALSFAAGLLALKLLSAVLERGQWKYFGYYCLGAAVVVFFLAVLGI
jgi:undecaprenyl-diphosphatase